MKRYPMLLLVLSVGAVFGQEVVPAPKLEQSPANETVKNDLVKGLLCVNKVILESAQITYRGIITACYSFIPTYIMIHLFRSGVPSVKDLIKALNNDERFRYAFCVGALGFVLHYSEVFKVNGKYINLSETEFDAAVEAWAKKFAERDPEMSYEEVRQKTLEYVKQKMRNAPYRILGACCSLAACAGLAYKYCTNA